MVSTYFHRNVLEKYKVNDILTPKNLGNEIINVSLYDLRYALNYCFEEIDAYFQSQLIEFIDDYQFEIGVNIKNQKKKIKSLKKKKKNTKIPDLIYDLETNLFFEKRILDYLKTQKYFLIHWTFEKIRQKEFNLFYDLEYSSKKIINKDFERQIFKSDVTFECFDEYTKKHIIEPYKDYGYLFQRLLELKLIYSIKHKDFIEWLFKKKYINAKSYEEFKIKGGFYSLGKATSIDRENNFNNIFNI